MSTLTYDIDEYQNNMLAAQRKHRAYMKTLFLVAIVCFGAGVASIYFEMSIVAVVLLALSVFFYQGSSYYHLLDDMHQAQWSLALLINKQTKEMEILRWELKQERESCARS